MKLLVKHVVFSAKVLLYGLTALVVLFLALGSLYISLNDSKNGSHPIKTYLLASTTNSSGRFSIMQKYILGEGWQVWMTYVDAKGRGQDYPLDSEAGSWEKVRIISSDKIIQIRGNIDLVFGNERTLALFDSESGVFKNCLYKYSVKYDPELKLNVTHRQQY